jgi:hypothetical protein
MCDHALMQIVSRTEECTVVDVPLASLADRAALEAALDELLAVTSDLPNVLRLPDGELSWALAFRFVMPDGAVLPEPAVQAACVGHPALWPKMLRYVQQIDLRSHDLALPYSEMLGHDELFPAGSFAIVELALADARHIAPLIEHLRGVDLDHESFHFALIDRLLTRHGVCDETLDLLAFRAVDGAGQNGQDNLVLAVRGHGLLEHWRAFGGFEQFVTRLKEKTRRTAYLSLYLANALHALSIDAPDTREAWLALAESRWAITFEPRERNQKLRERWRSEPFTDEQWQAEWDEYQLPATD